jgi:hypothetical protein
MVMVVVGMMMMITNDIGGFVGVRTYVVGM